MKLIIYKPFTKVILLLLILTGISSCTKDFLEVVPKDQISDLSVWETTTNADLFLNDVYNSVPGPYNAFDPEENYSDDSMDGINAVPTRQMYANSIYTPSSTIIYGNAQGYWGQYTNIRKCNLFIEKVTASVVLDDTWKKLRLAEVRYLRAYFYMLIWTRYGGAPIITNVLNFGLQGDDIFRARNTSEETVKFIADECAAIAVDLPLKAAESGRVTKGAALTLKGWSELFNASPLHNPTNDKAKWALAAATNKQVMDLAAYSLFSDYVTMFWEENNNNVESIFSKAYLGGTRIGGSREGIQGPSFANGTQISYGMVDPSQEIVDAYAMANGLPITDPASGYDPQKPYLNREKRFYQSIVYDGSLWLGYEMISRQGLGSKNTMDLSGASGVTKTSYYLKKGLNPKYAIIGINQLNSASYMVFRYAEVLLSYAEAQNEAAGPDASVYDAMNKVRLRSELPSLTAGFTQQQMRSEIRRERRVELAFEEKRWYDLIRWQIAETNLNGSLHGMKIDLVAGTWVYTVIPAPGGGRTFFANKNYYLPIPQSAIDRNSKLIQNPNY